MRVPSQRLMCAIARELKFLAGGCYEVSWVPYKSVFNIHYLLTPINSNGISISLETAIECITGRTNIITQLPQ